MGGPDIYCGTLSSYEKWAGHRVSTHKLCPCTCPLHLRAYFMRNLSFLAILNESFIMCCCCCVADPHLSIYFVADYVFLNLSGLTRVRKVIYHERESKIQNALVHLTFITPSHLTSSPCYLISLSVLALLLV